MSPTQQRVEVDHDRKEELILAKQLRACRVQILPRNNDNCYQLRSSVSPLPTPTSPRSPFTPKNEKILSAGPSRAQAENPRQFATDRDVMEELNIKMQRISQVKDSVRGQKQSSPVILINGEEDVRQSPLASSPIKLPFLNDIKQLRRAEPHTPSAVFTPAMAASGGQVGQRTVSSPPFLDDIRKLRKDSTQTNDVDREDCENTTSSQPHIQNVDSKSQNIYNYQKQTAFNVESSGPEMPASSSKFIGGAKEKFQNDLLKFNKDGILSVSPPTKSVRFSTFDVAEPRLEADNVSKQIEVNESDDSDLKSSRTPKSKKCSSKFSVKIDEKTNISRFADTVIPQLNNMQKNFLGLLFFNELSQNIVDDIVAQQLSMMSGSKLASVLGSLDQQASCTAINMLMNSCGEESKLSVLCDNFSCLSSEEKAGVLFTTSDDVSDICTTIADFGGRNFKKSLISKLIADEDDQFLVELQERPERRKVSHLSSAEETYNSAEESPAEDVGQYEYFDFDNK